MNYFLSFVAYSFLGWCCETTYCSIGAGHFINRGFLSGPVCPVYGFGAMAVILLLEPVKNSAALVFLLGMAVASVLEYITGWLLETLFHTKWWDYSTYRFNIHGRVCLRNSLMFGGLAIVAVQILNPWVQKQIALIPFWWRLGLVGAIGLYFAADTAITVQTILELNGRLEQMQNLVLGMKARQQEHRQALEASLQEHLRQLAQSSKLRHRRLLQAFPNMRSSRYQAALEKLKEELAEKRRSR